MTNFRSPFSYYGAKSKIAALYPAPQCDVIIEPFCGSAAYAFMYWERQVLVNDLDPITASIWRFLTSSHAADDVERYVPETVRAGLRVSDILPETCDAGLLGLLRAEANRGTQGARGCHDQITPMAEKCWNARLKRKLLDVVIPRVAHWQVSEDPYDVLPNIRATWFVDPPYANSAGGRYRTNAVNYMALAKWCRARNGQVIVCENEGARWMAFHPLGSSARGIKSRYQKADTQEVVWYRPAQDEDTWTIGQPTAISPRTGATTTRCRTR